MWMSVVWVVTATRMQLVLIFQEVTFVHVKKDLQEIQRIVKVGKEYSIFISITF